FTLRFARIKRVRYDKNWEDCLSFHNFLEINDEKLNRNEKTFDDLAESAEFCQNNIFSNFNFYILNGNKDFSKKEIEKLIKENGGKIHANPIFDKTHFIVVGSEEEAIKSSKYQNLVKFDCFKILKLSFIRDCVKNNQFSNLDFRFSIIL
ncbi:hypothetical protein MHBO_004737, partial [Bonamia ostreae]